MYLQRPHLDEPALCAIGRVCTYLNAAFNIKQEIQTLNEFPARCPYADQNIYFGLIIRQRVKKDF